TQQCIEIPFTADAKQPTMNDNCIMSWVKRSDYTGYIAYAYSKDVIIDKGYGQNAVGGSATTPQLSGYFVACTGSTKCPPGGANVTPVSGGASGWSKTAINSKWLSKCSGKGG
ncbi:MAG: hypothetical protein ACRELG_04925, partial [Gemmataceae bacterium]